MIGHRQFFWPAVLPILVLPLVLPAQQSKPAQNKQRAAAFQKLQQRFKNAPGQRGSLYDDLITFRQKHPGTSEARQVARLLQQCPSPLDHLQPTADVKNQFKKYPKELVLILKPHFRAIKSIAFSPDGRLLAGGCWDNTIRIWKITDKELKLWATLKGSPSQLAFTPDGACLIGGTTGTKLEVWDITGKEPKRKAELAGHDARPFALAVSPDGRILASGSSDPLLRVCNIDEGKITTYAVFSGDNAPNIGVTSISFSADSKFLAVGSLAGKRTLRIWNLGGPFLQEVTFPVAKARCVRFSPVSRTLLVGKEDGVLELWQFDANKFWRKHILNDHQKIGFPVPVRAVAFSPSGHQLASAGENKELILWDPATGKKLHQWLLAAKVNALAFAPDGRHLVTANRDGSLYLWRLGSPAANGKTNR